MLQNVKYILVKKVDLFYEGLYQSSDLLTPRMVRFEVTTSVVIFLKPIRSESNGDEGCSLLSLHTHQKCPMVESEPVDFSKKTSE